MRDFLKWRYLFALILVFLAIAQFFKIDKENPQVSSDLDFLMTETPRSHIAKMIKNQCYDCHSFESKYPWYTDYAPISWWIKSNINGAREELNFSEWALYDEKTKIAKIQECVEMLEEGEMPVGVYVSMHEEAQFPEDSTKALITWFKQFEVK